MNVKITLALSTALLMSASAFAADPATTGAGTTPDKMLPTGSAPAVSQVDGTTAPVDGAIAKDAATSTSATQQESTTTTTTGATGATPGTVAGDAQSTETTEVKKSEVKETETQAQSQSPSTSSPAVESSTTTGTTTSATTQTTTAPGQPNNVQKLFHMLQHNNTPQSGATSPETQPATGEKTAQ
jgi:hypothetical protein